MWTVAGSILCTRAIIWLDVFPAGVAATMESVSAGLAVGAYLLLFARLVRRNIDRIAGLPERACLFAFTPWRGYLMIGLMVGVGVTLRSSTIPRVYLSIPYAAMGGTLLIGSVMFFRRFVAHMVRGDPQGRPDSRSPRA